MVFPPLLQVGNSSIGPLDTPNVPNYTEVETARHPGGDTGPTLDLFLAGGISGCPDWQAEALSLAATWVEQTGHRLTIANPRRSDGIPKVGQVAAQQIKWEYDHLARARVVLFYFPEGRPDANGQLPIQPIALYELGKELGRRPSDQIIIGADSGYVRRFDLVTQVGLACPGQPIYPDLGSTVQAALTRVLSRP